MTTCALDRVGSHEDSKALIDVRPPPYVRKSGPITIQGYLHCGDVSQCFPNKEFRDSDREDYAFVPRTRK